LIFENSYFLIVKFKKSTSLARAPVEMKGFISLDTSHMS